MATTAFALSFTSTIGTPLLIPPFGLELSVTVIALTREDGRDATSRVAPAMTLPIPLAPPRETTSVTPFFVPPLRLDFGAAVLAVDQHRSTLWIRNTPLLEGNRQVQQFVGHFPQARDQHFVCLQRSIFLTEERPSKAAPKTIEAIRQYSPLAEFILDGPDLAGMDTAEDRGLAGPDEVCCLAK
jgi:hypothetical protein